MLHAFALRVFGSLPRRLRTRIIRTLYPTFTMGVCVCFRRPDERICMVTHSYSAGWGLPGGMLDGDESASQTAVREMREELGVDITITDPPVPVRSPRRKHFNLLFTVPVDDTTADAMASDLTRIIEGEEVVAA